MDSKYKLFWKLGDTNKSISKCSFNDDDEYYSFLKKKYDEGFRQIIISSEAMIKLIKYFVIKQDLKISEIQFNEEDPSLSEEVDALLEEIKYRPILFTILLEKLTFLSEDCSIDINRIYMTKKCNTSFFIQSNGIIGFSGNEDEGILNEICSLLKEYLFG